MYYTLEKTAEILELQPGDVNRLREQGKLRAFRDGSTWKFRKEDVEKYVVDMIRERSQKSAPAENLLNDADDELPTALADSAAFDSMIDQTSDAFVRANNIEDEGASELAPQSENDDFSLDSDSTDFSVESDASGALSDDGLSLADDSDAGVATLTLDASSVTSDDSVDSDFALADDASAELRLAPESADSDESAELQIADDSNGLPPVDGSDGLSLAGDSDDGDSSDDASADLQLAPESDSDASADLQLAPESDSDASADLQIVDDAAIDLTKDAADAPASANALDNPSDDNLLHLGSDSGLSLLDDVGNLDGSGISLGEEGDVVLGGSGSGSGSGSGLNLSGDSGLSLLDEAADDFTLDESSTVGGDSSSVSETSDVSSADSNAGTDDGIFELQDDSSAGADDGIFELQDDSSSILQLEKNVGEDSETILNANAAGPEQLVEIEDRKSQSDSVSQSIELASDESSSEIFTLEDAKEESLFTTSDDASASAFSLGGSVESTSAAGSNDSMFSLPSGGGSEFGASEFGASGLGGSEFGASGVESSGSFGSESEAFGSSSASVDDAPAPAAAPRAPETEYTGKDFIFLVPCLIFLILATIGAYELVRTIWSYENASFDLAGPLLDALAKMFKLV